VVGGCARRQEKRFVVTRLPHQTNSTNRLTLPLDLVTVLRTGRGTTPSRTGATVPNESPTSAFGPPTFAIMRTKKDRHEFQAPTLTTLSQI
jgi:hypothetical protein